MSRRWIHPAVGLVLMAATAATDARAGVIRVPEDARNLRVALRLASDGDRILLGNGIWTGDGNLGLSLHGKAVTIRSQYGAEHCIIDGGGMATWLTVTGAAAAGTVVDGLTFRRLYGEGILSRRTGIEIRNCHFEDCIGPCVQLDRVDAAISGCVFTGAAVTIPFTHYADAITAIGGQFSVDQCSFTDNFGANGSVYVDTDRVRVAGSEFRGNKGFSLRIKARDALVRDCTFSENASYGGYVLGLWAQRGSAVVQGCQFDQNSTRPDYQHGAVHLSGKKVALIDCDISATFGWGASVRGASAAVTRCRFSDNTVGMVASYGGQLAVTHVESVNNASAALYVHDYQQAIVEQSSFLTSQVGVIVGEVSLVMRDCLIAENSGRGLTVEGFAMPELRNCTIRDHTTTWDGAAIWGYGVRLVESVITGNSSQGDGGAIRSASIEAVNAVFSYNVAGGDGGAIRTSDGALSCTNCVFYGNVAGNGAGGGIYAVNATVTLDNSILRENEASLGPQIAIYYLTSLAGSYNNVSGGRESIWSPLETPDIKWKDGNIDVDPKFVDPSTGDFRLLPGSPCIDAGNNRAVSDIVTTDFDGNVRFHDDPDTPDTGRGRDGIVDMGVFEFAAPPPCTGQEQLRARCVTNEGQERIVVTIRGARPDARLTVSIDNRPLEPQVATVNARGRVRVTIDSHANKLKRVSVAECGLEARVRCHS